MAYIDFAIIVIVLIFFSKGYHSGLIKMLSWFVGLIGGIWLAGEYYLQSAEWLNSFIDSYLVSVVIGYVGIIVAAVVVVGFILGIINRFFNQLPVLGFANKLVGGVLGLLEAVVILGLTFWALTFLPMNNSFTRAVDDSQLRPVVVRSTEAIRWMLPETLKALAELKEKLELQTVDVEDLIQELQLEDFINKVSPQDLESLQQQFDTLSTEQQEGLIEGYESLSSEEQQQLQDQYISQ